MKQEVMSQFNQPWLPSLAMVLFIIVFVGMLIMVFRKKSKTIQEETSALPLNEGSSENE